MERRIARTIFTHRIVTWKCILARRRVAVNSIPIRRTVTVNSIPIRRRVAVNSVPIRRTVTVNSIPIRRRVAVNSIPIYRRVTVNSILIRRTVAVSSILIRSKVTVRKVLTRRKVRRMEEIPFWSHVGCLRDFVRRRCTRPNLVWAGSVTASAHSLTLTPVRGSLEGERVRTSIYKLGVLRSKMPRYGDERLLLQPNDKQ